MSGADLEYQRMLADAGIDPSGAQGYDAARLEQLGDEVGFSNEVTKAKEQIEETLAEDLADPQTVVGSAILDSVVELVRDDQATSLMMPQRREFGPVATGHAADLHGRLQANRSAVLLNISDSTGYDDTRWFYRWLTEYLMPMYPTHTVVYYCWNKDTHSYTYDAANSASGVRTLRTGTDGRTINDAVTTSGSTNVTSPTLNVLKPTDIGRPISGAGIPAGTTVAGYTQATQTLVLSQAATATANGVTITLAPHTLTVYNAAAPGKGVGEAQTYLPSMCPETPHLITVNHGHNHNLSSFLSVYFRPFLDQVQWQFPTAPIVLTAQNIPSADYYIGDTVTKYIGEQIALVSQVRAEARLRGMGLIDVAALWLGYGDGTPGAGGWDALNDNDDQHPKPGPNSGTQLWLEEVERLLGADSRGVGSVSPLPTATSFFIPASSFGAVTQDITSGTAGLSLPAAADTSVSTLVDMAVRAPGWKSWTMQVVGIVLNDPGSTKVARFAPSVTQVTLPADSIETTPGTTLAINSPTGQSQTVKFAAGQVRQPRINPGWTTPLGYPGTGVHFLTIKRNGLNVGDTLDQAFILLGVRYVKTA